MYEVIKFVSLDRHTTDFFIISTSKKTWNGCSAEEQGMDHAAMEDRDRLAVEGAAGGRSPTRSPS